MKTTAQKWGNSLAIRVPKSIAQQAGLKVKDDLDIEVRKGGARAEASPAPSLSAGGFGQTHDPTQYAQGTRLRRAGGS